jgi:hypothetical protein
MKTRIFGIQHALVGVAVAAVIGGVSSNAHAQACGTATETFINIFNNPGDTRCGGSTIYAAKSAGGYAIQGANSSSDGASAGGYFTGNTAAAAVGVAVGIYAHCTGSGCSAGYFDGQVKVNGVCQLGCSGSDERLKQHIAPLRNPLQTLLQLKGVTFEWKNPAEHENHTGTQIGVIAQDVEKVFPQWVGEHEGYKTVDPDARTVLALSVEGFRQLKSENDELRRRVNALEANRRPLISGMGQEAGALGLGFAALASVFMVSRRKRGI